MTMIRHDTRVDRDVIKDVDIFFAVPWWTPAASSETPGRKRKSFTSFVKRPARAPSRAVRAARITTALSRLRGKLSETKE
mmetsp:Transcript_2799/g.6825  ORF Transcript_2799/g.6825 Transcript_2799/m.6825 type:complete len:80 (-) Transcript_2799:435-674(-)